MHKITSIKNIEKIYGFDKSNNSKIVENSSIIIVDGKINSIVNDDEYETRLKMIKENLKEKFQFLQIDAKDKIVLPSFVDPHTHLIYAGDRADEFFLRNKGVSYLEIAGKGGGISSTVKRTRDASDEELLLLLLKRLSTLASFGVTHVEIKSGYGLTVKDEIRLLKIINKAKEYTNIKIIPTSMPAHDFPPEAKKDIKLKGKWIETIIHEILPEVKKNNLARFFDIFTEEKVFDYNSTERLCIAAIDNGLKIKMHVNELSNIGALKLAIDLKATSVEHLLQTKEEEVNLFENSTTVPVLLPATAFYLNERYAPFSLFEKYNVDVALASDSNPGSNCTENILMVYTIASIKLHMDAFQILKASTITAAKALELANFPGIIEEDYPANIIIVDAPSLEYIYYHYGTNPIEKVLIDGEDAYVKI